MSRIDGLIAEMCPDGVPMRLLGELVKNHDSKRRPVTKSLRAPGNYPYYGANGVQDYVDDYLFDGTFLLIGEDGSVKQADGTPVLNWATGKIWVNNHAHVLQSATEQLDLRYLYFSLQTRDVSALVTGGTQPKLNQKNLNRVLVPVPPLEVQREIVRVLDKFTRLEAELEAELKAELEARKLQYAHYRELLIAFREAGGVPWIPMGDIGEFIRGRRFTKKDVVRDGIPSIHYGEIYTRYGTATASTVSHIRNELAPKLRYALPGDVVIAAVGETVEDVGKAVAWLGNENVAIHDDCFLFRHTMVPKFVSYYLQTEAYHSQKAKYVDRAKIKRLSGRDLAKITIPVLPFAEQERIVAILDKFDALVNDLSVGLPAELAARRKQYEYYRDRLLAFDEPAA